MTGLRTIRISVNGTRRVCAVEPRRTLADCLREDLGLTGTHLGCEHGVCGACTVLLNGDAVRACLLLAVQAEGAEVMTVEGLDPAGYAALKASFSRHYALQCGFCTAGFLMTAVEILNSPQIDWNRAAIADAISGHVCRCTGYQPIVDAIEEAVATARAS